MTDHEELKMMLSEKQVFIFDLFHTLTSIESTHPFPLSTADDLGVSREKWNEQLLERSKDRLMGKLKDSYIFIRQMALAIDPALSEEIIRQATQNRVSRFRYSLVHVSGQVLGILKKLRARGKKLGLLSNADFSEIAGWIESPLSTCFDSVVFSCEVGCVKPEREIYGISLEQLSAPPEVAVFIGDGGNGELEGAKAVGLTTVFMSGLIRPLWPDSIEPRKRLADFSIESLEELMP